MKNNKKTLVIIILIIIIIIAFIAIMYFRNRGKEGQNVVEPNVPESSTVVKPTPQVDNKEKEETPTKVDEEPINENVEISDDNVKKNVSKELNESKSVGGFKISNISFTEGDGETTLLADVTNLTGSNKSTYTFFKITFLDDNGQEIITIPAAIGPVNNNEKTVLNAKIEGETNRYINAHDFNVVLDNK